MRRIVLDTSAIIAQPSSGSFSSPDTQLIIPHSVVTELVRAPSHVSQSYSSLVGQMVHSGTGLVVTAPEYGPVIMPPVQIGRVARLSMVERDVLAIADDLKREHPDDEILIATDDRDIEEVGRVLGVRAVSSKELATLLKGGQQDRQVKERADSLVRYQRKHLLWSALFGVTLTVSVTLFVQHISAIVGTARIWGTIVAIPLVALALFWIRNRQRLAYGLAEFGVGLIAAINVVWPTFRLAGVGVAAVIQLMGGLYIMVRGLDNIGLGVRGTTVDVYWQRWFPNQ